MDRMVRIWRKQRYRRYVPRYFFLSFLFFLDPRKPRKPTEIAAKSNFDSLNNNKPSRSSVESNNREKNWKSLLFT